MRSRDELLAEVREALAAGVLAESDLKSFVTPLAATSESKAEAALLASKPDKLSAVDVMFYVAGIVLYSAVLSAIVQSWEAGSVLVHIVLSAGFGAGLWAIAYKLIAGPVQNDIRKGLINALLLTGSLLLITGGYIITNEITGGYSELNLIPSAVMLAVLGALHLAFDKKVKRQLTLLMGVLLCVAAFPALMFGFLQNTRAPADIFAVILVVTAGILAYAARVVAKLNPDRQRISTSFDAFAAFLTLGTMYASSFSQYGLLWLLALICGVFGIFYWSIVSLNKQLLGNASFFLLLTVITISFKYFSGFGVTVSLTMATFGLLGSAAVAASINRKYFKKPAA